MNILEQPSPNELVFEMINVDVSLVNALRRLLLAEVPTVAVEKIFMWENSSLLHDEVLSHRLGLIPIRFDARLLEEVDNDEETGQERATDRNTIVFRLAVECDAEDVRGLRRVGEKRAHRLAVAGETGGAEEPLLGGFILEFEEANELGRLIGGKAAVVQAGEVFGFQSGDKGFHRLGLFGVIFGGLQGVADEEGHVRLLLFSVHWSGRGGVGSSHGAVWLAGAGRCSQDRTHDPR